jgi:hypothetical protein
MAVLPLESSHPGAEFNAQDTLEPSILTDAQSTCEHYQDEHIGRVDNQDGRFYYKAFVPVRSEWNAGARWVRCDIHVIKIGSTLAHPALENLPSYATLKKQLRSDPSQFDLCASVPGGTIAAGPRASGAVYASCTGNPQWQLLEYLNLPVPSDGFPYPSASQWKSYFETECVTLADPTQVPVPIYPTKAEWADGNYGFECWAGNK